MLETGLSQSALHPLAQERMVSVGGKWYYENILTGKLRVFPQEDDWEDEGLHSKPKRKLITQLVLITANIACSCGAQMRFKSHYTNPETPGKSSRKCDQIYVYLCSVCSVEVGMTYSDLERRILETTSI